MGTWRLNEFPMATVIMVYDGGEKHARMGINEQNPNQRGKVEHIYLHTQTHIKRQIHERYKL